MKINAVFGKWAEVNPAPVNYHHYFPAARLSTLDLPSVTSLLRLLQKALGEFIHRPARPPACLHHSGIEKPVEVVSMVLRD